MQKCVLFGIILTLFISAVPFVLGAELLVEKIPQNDIVVVGLERPANFTFLVTNNEDVNDTFQIYSLIEPDFSPTGFFDIGSGETREFQVIIDPREKIKEEVLTYSSPLYSFSYEIKGRETGFFRDFLTVKIISFEDLFEFSSVSFAPGAEGTLITITNIENFDIGPIALRAESSFFDFENEFSLGPEEEINVTIPINQESISGISAGTYPMMITLGAENASFVFEHEIALLERESITVSESTDGFFVRRKTISKRNEGNIPTLVIVTESVNIFERFFTTFSQNPGSVTRNGLSLEYQWEELLEPAQSLSINSVTNFTFPFVLVVIVFLLGFIVKVSMYRSLSLEKRVSYVKTKGGEFALKIRLRAKARKNVKNVKVTDTIPKATKLYTGYGIKPDSIDEVTRRVSWNLNNLNAGEERIYSYIIYSKMKMIGTFSLPVANAYYELGGKGEKISSNKTSFVAESGAIDVPEAVPSDI